MIDNVKNLKDKILWFSLPFIITFFSWLVLSISNIEGSIQSIKVENKKDAEQQEKIWEMIQDIQNYNTESFDARNKKLDDMWVLIQDNNKILESKADEQENKKDHIYLSTQLQNVLNKVDRLYVINNYTHVDTTLNYVEYNKKINIEDNKNYE